MFVILQCNYTQNFRTKSQSSTKLWAWTGFIDSELLVSHVELQICENLSSSTSCSPVTLFKKMDTPSLWNAPVKVGDLDAQLVEIPLGQFAGFVICAPPLEWYTDNPFLV